MGLCVPLITISNILEGVRPVRQKLQVFQVASVSRMKPQENKPQHILWQNMPKEVDNTNNFVT